jgi:hypothetical protein
MYCRLKINWVIRGASVKGSPFLPPRSRYLPGTTRLSCIHGVLQTLPASFPWFGMASGEVRTSL